MREHIFRAWDKEKKEMSPGMQLAMLSGFMYAHYSEGRDLGRFVWLEYTGFKDENKKGMYEGDIVKATAGKGYKKNSCTSDIIRNKSGQWQVRVPEDKMIYTHGLPLDWGGWKFLEVIGDIYSNPELLKVNK